MYNSRITFCATTKKPDSVVFQSVKPNQYTLGNNVVYDCGDPTEYKVAKLIYFIKGDHSDGKVHFSISEVFVYDKQPVSGSEQEGKS